MAAQDERRGISRRTLLVGGGVGVGLVLAWGLWPRRYAPNLRAHEGETLFNAYLKIGRDGRVVVAVPQAEIGQGVYTALPQILADELGADWNTVSVEPAPISPLYANLMLAEDAAGDSVFPGLFGIDRWAARRYATGNAMMLTAGSTSVRAFEAPLREAGAGARALLSKAAARRWNVDWRELDSFGGFVRRGNDRIAFAELAEAAAGEDLPGNLPVRGGAENRLVGQPLPRIDLPAKIDGSAMFAGDVRLRDMLFAAVRSAPPGSRRIEINHEAADAVIGARKLIENPDWIAVAATNWWAAAKALNALNPIYEVPGGQPSSRTIAAALSNALDSGDQSRIFEQGEIGAEGDGTSAINQRYEVAPAPSAPIEPLTATARLTGDRLELWAPTQAPSLARAAAARAIGFSEERVTLYPTLVGGGYGRKLETDAIEQAAVIAVNLGQPVQVTWPRIQEIQRDTLRPPAAAQMTAWVSGGLIQGWRALIAAPEAASATARRLRASGNFFRPDGGAVAGAVPGYGIANIAVDHVAVETGLETGIWRGGAHSYTCFFTESFVDEIARAAGQEPLSYRMAMLGNNPRLARCLATATSIGGWDGGPPGSGMGIACHSAFGSYIACLVEVEVSREQRVRVVRAVCAVDCGRPINPEIIKQQIEGGLVHGISAAVARPIDYQNGLPSARTIGAYGLPILRDAPDVTVELLESDEESGGVTELAVPVAAPAVANAYFSLSGRRVRTLPIQVGSQP